MLRLYTDGGVILKNPSPIGGTFAWVIVINDKVVDSEVGVITPIEMMTDLVTNNQTELLAAIHGLHNIAGMEKDVIVHSDSSTTIGRVFKKFPFNNIPDWMVMLLKREQKRLEHFRTFRYVQLDGHPTKQQLAQGFGKRGNPVSKWNVLCDQMCNDAAQKYLDEHPRILSTFLESKKLKITT